MPIAQSLLPEFDHEMKTTRALLERVPDDRASWTPHAKSMTLGRLAAHVAQLPGLGFLCTQGDAHDMMPVGGEPFRAPEFTSTANLLATFDEKAAQVRTAIAGLDDTQIMQPWSLQAAGNTIFTMPRVAVLRSFMMNHLIHHRGQLSVYLRMNDVPLPPIYGPTADESM